MTKLVTLKVDETLLASFDMWCVKRGTSRSAALRAFMAQPIDMLVRDVDAIVAKPIDPNGACAHPKAKEDKKPYGVWCGVCRVKIR